VKIQLNRKIMSKSLNEKRLTLINFIIVTYFIAIYVLYLYKIDSVLIGVFREILTIPFFIAQIVFLVLGIKFLIMEKNRRYLTIISVLILAICAIITIGSFF